MDIEPASAIHDGAEPAGLSAAAEAPNHRLRLLWIGGVEPSWVGLSLRLDAAGYLESRFHWASNANRALTALREENFDCVLVSEPAGGEPDVPANSPLPLLQAVRGSGYHDPIVYVTSKADDELCARLCALDCDLLVTANSSDSPALLPLIQRAVAAAERTRENQRLSVVQQRRLAREREEAEHLLEQQRGIIAKLDCPRLEFTDRRHQHHPAAESPDSDLQSAAARAELPDETNDFYHELLRTYVIMGSGSLTVEIEGFSGVLAAAGIGPQQALEFHLERVESLVRDLGNRSARHVMARADLLALELTVQLGEHYRQGHQSGAETGPSQADFEMSSRSGARK